jgi:predicted HicB family RNase H-like nuclease
MNKTTNLNIRNFSPELLRKIKSVAALQGKTLRQWAIEALQEKLRREK